MPRIGRHFMPNMKRAAWGFMQSGDFPVPVCHLKFGKNTGAIAYDSSPEGNDGVIDGCTWAKGYLGPGLDFDGIDNYVYVPHADSLDIRNEITLITRVYITEAINTTSFLAKGWYWRFWESVTFDSFGTTMQDSEDSVFTIYSAAGTLTANLNKWVELATTYSVTDELTILYLNGVEVNRKDTDGYPLIDLTAHDLWLGRRGDWYKGLIDENVIFNEVLTAAQIRQWNQGIR